MLPSCKLLKVQLNKYNSVFFFKRAKDPSKFEFPKKIFLIEIFENVVMNNAASSPEILKNWAVSIAKSVLIKKDPPIKNVNRAITEQLLIFTVAPID